MLKIRAMVFIQDETYDDTGYNIVDIYNRKISLLFIPNPEESAEQCIIENVKKALSRLSEEVEITLKTESKYDIEYVYEKNVIPMWSDPPEGGAE